MKKNIIKLVIINIVAFLLFINRTTAQDNVLHLHIYCGPPLWHDSTKLPLVFIDSIEIPIRLLANINPENVETVNILHDTAAIKLYGDKAKYGAIIIKTKSSPKNIKSDKYVYP